MAIPIESTYRRALAEIAITILPTDISFIDLDDAHELAEIRIGHTGPKPMTHIPSRTVRAGAEHPVVALVDTHRSG
jgi:hypothetical protein